jgi:putative transposase
MKKSRFTDSQILVVLKEAAACMAVPEPYRTHWFSTATFRNWRTKFGGMDVPLMARMTQLEDENGRLNKIYAAAKLRTDLLREALDRMVRPSQRRAIA